MLAEATFDRFKKSFISLTFCLLEVMKLVLEQIHELNLRGYDLQISVLSV
jgi:hypothetical protein